jgi:hypothetical protein
MSVIIQNISESEGKPYGSGEQLYQLRINNLHKAYVRHNFEDGLASLLRESALALEEAESI